MRAFWIVGLVLVVLSCNRYHRVELGSRKPVEVEKVSPPQLPVADVVTLQPVVTAPPRVSPSSSRGMTYLGKVLRVDEVLPQEADDTYGVKIRLRSETGSPLTAQYKIRFTSADGVMIRGQRRGWTVFVIEPYRYAAINDSARVRGAVGFRLAVRRAGSDDSGAPDGAAAYPWSDEDEPVSNASSPAEGTPKRE